MCLAEYPQFKADFDILHRYGYVKVVSDTTLEWTKTQTSLAEYFKWIGAPHPVTGGFWGPVSKCFGVDQRALSRAASPNGNPLAGLLEGLPQDQKDSGRTPGQDTGHAKGTATFQESEKACSGGRKRRTGKNT
jgi:hypothetical protein